MPLIFHGSCDRAIFTIWLEYLLRSLQLSSTNHQKEHLIILDNASIHKSKEIDQLVAQYHMHIVYLPTYIPDFNGIEKACSVLKRKVHYLVNHQKISILNVLKIVFKKRQ